MSFKSYVPFCLCNLKLTKQASPSSMHTEMQRKLYGQQLVKKKFTMDLLTDLQVL